MNGTNVSEVADGCISCLMLFLFIDDFIDTDRVFGHFLQACRDVGFFSFLNEITMMPRMLADNTFQVGPDRCALASNNSTSSTIGTRIDKFLSDLYDYPLPVDKANRPGALTSGMVRGNVCIIGCQCVNMLTLWLPYRSYLLQFVCPAHMARSRHEPRCCHAGKWNSPHERPAEQYQS